MGALHEGHLALIRQAARDNHWVYVSIYVNPTQFGVNEDLGSYPRNWKQDFSILQSLQQEFRRPRYQGRIGVVFMPNSTEMYPGLPPSSEPNGDGSFVTITPLARRLEGASRPVFFRGVATVVMKLLNIVRPTSVYFGQKDIQQTFVIKRMVKDFHMDTEVVVGPTVREPDGLALSSRNVYLGERRRKVALVLSKALRAAETAFAQGARKRRYLYAAAKDVLESAKKQQDALPSDQRARFEIDYISIADTETLDELEELDSRKGAIVSGAIKMLPIQEARQGEHLGQNEDATTVRLIDNIRLDLLSAKLGFLKR
ncbi:uncharacterized protein KY384_007719 [Bacidia gigantensis]|uniref:uncharacterized protein n=1 Tax=Bacidia gigantensis TaxID=2732470 RepID=UPI001D0361B3|nr:uncharacterized protein KY384_007719 [Bacidia gigantensis]KAG8527566.1 hypothetical protein KY384_007719 [Bacidia gigantensis]